MLLELLSYIKRKNSFLSVDNRKVSIRSNSKIRKACNISVMLNTLRSMLFIQSDNYLYVLLRRNSCIPDRLNSEQSGHNRALVIRCSTAVHISILNNRIERTVHPVISCRNDIKMSDNTKCFVSGITGEHYLPCIVIIVVNFKAHALAKLQEMYERILHPFSKWIHLSVRSSYGIRHGAVDSYRIGELFNHFRI